MNLRPCLLREGEEYNYDKLAERCGDRDLVKHALRAFREAVEEFAISFAKISRRIFGARIVVDSPPPIVLGTRVFAGYWSGVFTYSRDGKGVTIVVVPRVRNYVAMIDKIDSVLGKVSADFRALLRAVPTSGVGYAVGLHALRVLGEALYLAYREPRRYAVRTQSDPGYEVELAPGPATSIAIYGRTYSANAELFTALALATRSVVLGIKKALQTAEEIRDSLKEVPEAYAFLSSAVSRYKSDIINIVNSFISDEVIQASLVFDEFAEDVGRYHYLVRGAKAVETGMAYSPTRGETASFLLYPSTKLYELYTLAHLVESATKCNGGIRYLGRLAVEAGQIKAYFNRYPRKLSRVVAHITRGLTPRPDILVASDGKVVVIDAKYRRLDGAKPRLLGLGDAERLAAYILDASRNAELKAVVVALSKPPERLLQKIASSIKGINGKSIKVEFVELDPDGKADDLYGRVVGVACS